VESHSGRTLFDVEKDWESDLLGISKSQSSSRAASASSLSAASTTRFTRQPPPLPLPLPLLPPSVPMRPQADRSSSSETRQTLPHRPRRHHAEPDAFTQSSTIRPVTPESSIDPTSPLQVSPHTSVGESPGNLARPIRTRASSSTDRMAHGFGFRDPTYPQLRPRTRTLDGRISREQSPPPTAIGSSRSRLGSVSSAGALYGPAEDVVTSIGQPSIVPPPYNIPVRQKTEILPPSRGKLSKSHPQNRDGGASVKHLDESPLPQPQPLPLPLPLSQSLSQSQSQSLPSHAPMRPAMAPQPMEHYSDTRKILELMKSSCGKMEGQLAFRRLETTPWSLSYCMINDETGSLVYEPKGGDTYYRTLIPDLRGCNIQAAWDAESQMPYLDMCPPNSKLRIHLRPHTKDEFDSWFAALLCWYPIRPKGAQNRMTKPQIPIMGERRATDGRRLSEVALAKEPPIIKIGKMIYWDTNAIPSSRTPSKAGKTPQAQPSSTTSSRRWQPVSSTLRENGELKLHLEQDMSLLASVQLSQLSRCAVQRLDPSVLNADFCIAIYPQYAATASPQTSQQPIFLSLESRVLYEVWLVLFRAFTIPQLYGPKPSMPVSEAEVAPDVRPKSYHTAMSGMFRMERTLSVRIVESKLVQPMSPRLSEPAPFFGPQQQNGSSSKYSGGYYAELLFDGETRAKTIVDSKNPLNPYWREEFEFADLPAAVSVASIALKKRPPSQHGNERIMKEESRKMHKVLNGAVGSPGSGLSGVRSDETYGQVDVFLDDLIPGNQAEKWFPLVNTFGQGVGEILAKISAEENVILMAAEYQPMSELLHRFSNGLTLQLSSVTSSELKRLSECLLNIFQVSGSASEWIMSLAEEEIDGTVKEAPASRLRLTNRRLSSNENSEAAPGFSTHVDRELLVRDMGKSATLEANLLFRGNTLLTKSLDLHMKRLGKEYLEETLGDMLKEIADSDPDCEVDPNRISNQNELDRNWRRLINLTAQCWKCIFNSALKCPVELRSIFRHIRHCAEDRYGDFLRTVSYSSVSGFLFLRFFCPAILNPKLFGLIKGKFSIATSVKILITKIPSRQSSEEFPTHLHPHRQVPPRTCQHEHFWRQGALDGANELVSVVSPHRV
jgi:hypothetical protein